tara:strand:- start:2236 stop:2817 length:582 start_codon:yes stop_codon:yes gene_type:complete
MAVCDLLTAGIAYDCANPPSGGANDRLILVNFADIDGNVTYNVSNALVVEAITLPALTYGYVFEGLNNSNEPRAALVKGRYVNGYDHEVRFKCFSNSIAAKAQLTKLDGALVVAIVQNNHKGAAGEAAFEIYGLQTGLRLQELERILADAELQGAYNLLLKNDEVSKPSTLPHTLYITDFASSLAVVDGILEP